jgi:hypothetical protein
VAEVPGIVWNNSGHASGVARQSATIVADNRLALAPSMAVEYSRVFSLLAPCWRGASAPLVVGHFISTRSLRGAFNTSTNSGTELFADRDWRILRCRLYAKLRKPTARTRAINKGITLASVLTLMTAVVEFYRAQNTQIVRRANHEVEMFRHNAIQYRAVLRPIKPYRRSQYIRHPNLCEYRKLAACDLVEDAKQGMLCW